MLIQARKLLVYSPHELWNMLTGEFDIQFDDGIVRTNCRNVLLSNYIWNFHRHYPNTPLYSKYLLIKPGDTSPSFNMDKLTSLLEDVYWDTVNFNALKSKSRISMNRLTYEIVSDLYNDCVMNVQEYVTTLDITDFVKILKHPTVVGELDKITINTKGFNQLNAAIIDTIKNNPELASGNVAKIIDSKSANQNQLNQCIGVRGVATEIDGSYLPVPIIAGFAGGLKTIYNGAAEARSAVKSIYLNAAEIGNTEYAARRLQMLTMLVEKLYIDEDCGSTEYLHWTVEPAGIRDDGTKYGGDLSYLVGKYYLKDDNTLAEITPKCTHLIGQTLKLRSTLFCKHHDAHGVCGVCFGALSNNFTTTTHLGHACAAFMSAQQTQSILSTKHLDGMNSGNIIGLSAVGARYFEVVQNKSYRLLSTNNKIKIPRTAFTGIVDLEFVDDVHELNTNSVATIDRIRIQPIGATDDELIIMPEKQSVVFSYEMLDYIKNNMNTRVDYDEDFVIVDTTDLDPEHNMFDVIQKEYSYSTHAKDVFKIIESRMSEIMDRKKQQTPASTLHELFKLVNAKLQVNLALLEVITYAVMIRGEDDYGLARNSPQACLGVANVTISNRSLSTKLLYNAQQEALMNPGSFYKNNRPDHPMDVYFVPQEVTDQYKS